MSCRHERTCNWCAGPRTWTRSSMTWSSSQSWRLSASTLGGLCSRKSTGPSSSYLLAAQASSSGQGRAPLYTSHIHPCALVNATPPPHPPRHPNPPLIPCDVGFYTSASSSAQSCHSCPPLTPLEWLCPLLAHTVSPAPLSDFYCCISGLWSTVHAAWCDSCNAGARLDMLCCSLRENER